MDSLLTVMEGGKLEAMMSIGYMHTLSTTICLMLEGVLGRI